MMTYRYRGHSMSDPGKYRKRDEVDMWRQERDPIEQVKMRLLEAGILSDDEVKAIESEVRAVVAKAADFATTAPEPAPSELWTDVVI